MTSPSSASQVARDAGEYLDLLHELCLAIEGGIAALCGNRLDDFKIHVVRQEGLCARLRVAIQKADASSLLGLPSAIPAGEKQLAPMICAAHRRLAALNRRYAGLLRRSGRWVNMLSAHCRTYLDGFEPATKVLPCCHTWSSEI
jgi:hypothetical protein